MQPSSTPPAVLHHVDRTPIATSLLPALPSADASLAITIVPEEIPLKVVPSGFRRKVLHLHPGGSRQGGGQLQDPLDRPDHRLINDMCISGINLRRSSRTPWTVLGGILAARIHVETTPLVRSAEEGLSAVARRIMKAIRTVTASWILASRIPAVRTLIARRPGEGGPSASVQEDSRVIRLSGAMTTLAPRTPAVPTPTAKPEEDVPFANAGPIMREIRSSTASSILACNLPAESTPIVRTPAPGPSATVARATAGIRSSGATAFPASTTPAAPMRTVNRETTAPCVPAGRATLETLTTSSKAVSWSPAAPAPAEPTLNASPAEEAPSANVPRVIPEILTSTASWILAQSIPVVSPDPSLAKIRILN